MDSWDIPLESDLEDIPPESTPPLIRGFNILFSISNFTVLCTILIKQIKAINLTVKLN